MKRKMYMAWARVSSREQEQEGFSLDVQENGFLDWGKRKNAIVHPIFKASETATKTEVRKKFKEMIRFAKKHAHEYDGILFYKIDRAARNLKDFVELEELESRYDLPFIAITQPVENTPTGRMLRRTLATMAAFQTEQQSLDVRDGIARRVAEGWFPSTPPFGYRNRRIDKRSYVETHPQNGNKVRRIFDLRANQNYTITEIVEKLFDDGLFYSESKPKFSESKIGSMLHDKSYLGYIFFRGAWYPGQHEPLVDQLTWDQVRVSFNEQTYRSHELVYGSRLIRCGHCGHIVSGEEKFKETKKGLKPYIYYRCSRYRTAGHPQVRLTERELDRQLQEMFDSVGDMSDQSRSLVQMVARSILETRFEDEKVQVSESKRLLSLLETQRQKLLSGDRLAKGTHIGGEIGAESGPAVAHSAWCSFFRSCISGGKDAHGGTLRTHSAGSSRWDEHSGDGPAVRALAQDDSQGAQKLRRTAAVSAAGAAVGSQAGGFSRGDLGDAPGGPDGSAEAASHADADFRAAAG